ncbi:MAG: hypothetical protein N2645_21555 [Clostridia bacterium]|nr:hypothetical protein [Clostridia bacterium]
MIKRKVFLLVFVLLMVFNACNQRQLEDVAANQTTQVQSSNPQNSADIDMEKDAEIKAYKGFIEKKKIDLFKPSFTAGHSFVENTSFSNYGRENTFSAWYKKGDSYFEIVGGLLTNLGDPQAKGEGTLLGTKYFFVDKFVIWWPKDAQGLTRYAYGINFEKANLTKEEIKKIIESFKKV